MDWTTLTPFSPDAYTHNDPVLYKRPDGMLITVLVGNGRNLWKSEEQTDHTLGSFTHITNADTDNFIERPAVAAQADGKLVMVVRDAYNQLYFVKEQAIRGAWTAPVAINAAVAIGNPCVAMNKNQELQVFFRDETGSICTVMQTTANGNWGAVTKVGTGYCLSDPAVGWDKDGRLEVLTLGVNGNLQVAIQKADLTWQPLISIGGSLLGTPTVTACDDGRLAVFVRGADAKLYYAMQTAPNGAWGQLNLLNGALAGDPVAARDAAHRICVFALTPNGLQHISQQIENTMTWTTWTDTPRVTYCDRPAVMRNAANELYLLIKDRGNKLLTSHQLILTRV